jgi:hypothetical protein
MDCSKCIFATCTPPSSGGPFGTWQVGCKAGRLEKLKSRDEAFLPTPSGSFSEETSNYYQLSRFCNMYRSGLWRRGSGAVKDAAQEVVSSFGVVVEIDSHSKEEIETTLESIQNILYHSDKIPIMLSVKSSKEHTQYYVNSVIKLIGNGFDSRTIMHHTTDQNEIDKDAFSYFFQKRKVNYLVKISASDTIDDGFFSFIDKEINEHLNQTVFFEDCTNNTFAIGQGIVNTVYPESENYDLMSEKIKNISKEQKSYRKYEKKN